MKKTAKRKPEDIRQAIFRVRHDTWESFQSLCKDAGTNASAAINAFVDACVASGSIAEPSEVSDIDIDAKISSMIDARMLDIDAKISSMIDAKMADKSEPAAIATNQKPEPAAIPVEWQGKPMSQSKAAKLIGVTASLISQHKRAGDLIEWLNDRSDCLWVIDQDGKLIAAK